MKIVFTGGGTGGHFYPIIAVVQKVNQIIDQEHILGTQLCYFSNGPYDKEILVENRLLYEEIISGKMRTYFSLQNFSDILAKADRQVVARDGRESASPTIAKIEITRVALTEIKTYEDINFKTITKEDANLEKGVNKVEQEGIKGKKELVYEVRRENGQEVNRKLIKTETVKDPQEKIIVKNVSAATDQDLLIESVSFEPAQPITNQTVKIIIRAKYIGSSSLTSNIGVNNVAFSHKDFQTQISSLTGASVVPSPAYPLYSGT